jgi:membrane metallo-endopeptidase-like protein 1
MTVRQLDKNFPTIPWLEYFNNLLAPGIGITEDEQVIVNVPSFISDLERLLQQTPKRVQANYIMFRAAASSVSYLTDDIRKVQLAYSTIVSGK